ncbi:MAG: YihY/virulence factor BrkB family protein [Pseudomonadota bacterium]
MTRGRSATAPYAIPPRGWLDIIWRIWTRLSRNRIGLVAAGVAFYGLFSLFPAITAAVATVGLIFDAQLLLERADFLLAALPDAAGELITAQIAQVANASGDSLGWTALLSVALALWSASRAMGSMIQGLNLTYNEEEARGFIALKAITMAMTLAVIVFLSLAVSVVAAIPAALMFIGAPAAWADAALVLRWPVMLGLGVVAIAALYRYAPSRRPASWKWLSPGALLGCILWVAGSFGFSLYVQSFGTYNQTFGTLAGVVILMTWLWLSAFVVLLGALLDAELEAQTRQDTTVGRDRPMGERGAVKADTLGEAFRQGAGT